MPLNDQQLADCREYLLGSCKDTGDAIAAFNLEDHIDETQLQEQLLDVDVEICVQCNWWHEVFELQHSESHGGGLCEDCCETEGIEFQ